MNYANQADMLAAFGVRELTMLTDRALSGSLDTAVLATALDEANAEVDAFLQGRYALPLASVPRLLTRICCDIARYRLCGGDAQETEPVRNRYRDAHRILEKIKDGELTLGLDASQQEVGTRSTIRIQDGRRTFGRDALADY
ncbi:phage protein Gp36 family protein [Chitinivorax sp. PXF-14]|uniref:gp436 family protein n=1 Tax=Chitinivorax sp. PXF-14 TaxID=3230488 RepID=UPI003466AF7A